MTTNHIAHEPGLRRSIGPIGTFARIAFYRASMLLAAARGYAGCEVLALSNWLLRRDDQIGCMVFGPVDAAEHATRRTIAAR